MKFEEVSFEQIENMLNVKAGSVPDAAPADGGCVNGCTYAGTCMEGCTYAGICWNGCTNWGRCRNGCTNP